MATFNAQKMAERLLDWLLDYGVDDAPMINPADLAVVIREAAGDCLAHCQDDEPIFVLCARDVLAPAAVEDWARRVSACADPDWDKVSGARACADQMERWEGKKKLPGKTKAARQIPGD